MQSLARRQFRECNEIKINKCSVTISYPSKYSSSYDCYLTQIYGEPVDKSESANGKKYSIPGGIFVTNDGKSGSDSTLFFQGNRKLFDDVDTEFPQIFKEVLKNSINDETATAKRKMTPRPYTGNKCDQCDEET